MKKHWTKTSDFNYKLLVDEREVGKMEIHYNTVSAKAIYTINGNAFEIKRTGFWKLNIEITDSKGVVVLKTYPEKWYANTSVIEFENKRYKLLVRNNPLAEYAVAENDKDVLIYSLSAENTEPRISISSSGNTDYTFDFLLWYLFLPVATENFGDADSFLLLIA